MADITQTHKRDPGWVLGRNPKAIERQEAEGQQELAQSSQLPIDGLDTLPLEEWGIKVLDKRGKESDPLFTHVQLPEGWKIHPFSDHAMWSWLDNEKNEHMAEIFYKAAYYDRRAFIRIYKP